MSVQVFYPLMLGLGIYPKDALLRSLKIFFTGRIGKENVIYLYNEVLLSGKKFNDIMEFLGK